MILLFITVFFLTILTLFSAKIFLRIQKQLKQKLFFLKIPK